jgi:exodeoxyribonuclease V gamma subunit
MIKYRTFSNLEQIILELSKLPSLDHPLASRWFVCPTISVNKRIIDEITERTGFFCQAQVLVLEEAYQAILDRIYLKTISQPSSNEITTILLEKLDEILDQPQTENLKKIVGKPLKKAQNQSLQSIQSSHESTISDQSIISDISNTNLEEELLSQKIQSKEQRRLVAIQKISRSLVNIIQNRPYWLQQWQKNKLDFSYNPKLQTLIDVLNQTRSKSPEAYLTSFWPVLWQVLKTEMNTEVMDEFFLEKTLDRLLQNPQIFKGSQVKEIILVGIHQLDPYTLMLYETLSENIEITIYGLSPLPIFNQQLIKSNQVIRTLKDKDHLLQQLKNPLNRHLGAQALNLAIVLQKRKEALEIEYSLLDQPFNLQASQGFLGQVQRSLLADMPRPLDTEAVQTPINLRFHGCHYASRQVDVLYDELCALFRKDPTLKPREVLVLAPDIETYLPYIQSTFNGQNGRLGSTIERFRARNICVDLLSKLIELANGRFYRYDVFEILKQPAVCACFHLNLDEILNLENLIKETGIIWGKDQEHRLKLDLNATGHHTWAYGLDRILLGQMFGYVDQKINDEIYPKKISQDDLLIKFFEFYTALTKVTDEFSKSMSASAWIKALYRALDLLMIKDDLYLFKIENTKRMIGQVLGSLKAKIQSISPMMILGLFSGELGEEYQLKNANQDLVFFSTIQKASVLNARVICLLGMNDDEYPERSKESRFLRSDDEKSEILEDRHLAIQNVQFLQVIQQAKDALLIFYNAHSSDHSATLPCLPVQLLQEEIKHRFHLNPKQNIIDQLTHIHPLHPFSYQNFLADQENQPSDQTLGHQKVWFEGAKAWREAQLNPKMPQKFAHPPITLNDQQKKSVSIDELVNFFKKPSEYFLKNEIGVKLKEDQAITREREILVLDSLQVWKVKDQILKFFVDQQINSHAIQPDSKEKCFEKLFQDQLLPVGNMGRLVFNEFFDQVKSVHQGFQVETQSLKAIDQSFTIKTNLQTTANQSFEIAVPANQVYENKTVIEEISDITGGNAGEEIKYDKLVKLWIYHVAMCANQNQMPYHESVLVADDKVIHLDLIETQKAQSILTNLCEMYLEGKTRPIRFDSKLSAQFVKAASNDEKSLETLDKAPKYANDYAEISFNQTPVYIEEKNMIDPSTNAMLTIQELHPEFKEFANLFYKDLIDRVDQQK